MLSFCCCGAAMGNCDAFRSVRGELNWDQKASCIFVTTPRGSSRARRAQGAPDVLLVDHPGCSWYLWHSQG